MALTYASNKKYFKLCPEIQDSVAVNRRIILQSNIYVILCGEVKRTGVKDSHIKFTLLAGTHFH